MEKFRVSGKITNKDQTVKVRLIILSFKDENDINILYAPLLDLSGYGNTIEDAKNSFDYALTEFIDYTAFKKNTIHKVLRKLGWTLKGKVKRPRKLIAPNFADVIQKKKYVSDVFDNYSVQTMHEDVNIPVYA